MKSLQILELGNDEFIDSSTLNENDIKLYRRKKDSIKVYIK